MTGSPAQNSRSRVSVVQEGERWVVEPTIGVVNCLPKTMTRRRMILRFLA